MSKTKKNKDKPLLFPPDFVIAVAEKGLGFVKDKMKGLRGREVPIWIDQREGGIAHCTSDRYPGLNHFFLSLEGRELMETEAGKLGNIFCRFFREQEYQSDHGPWTQKPIWFYEFNRCTATDKDRNTACLLAFAQLVGVGRPKEYGDQ